MRKLFYDFNNPPMPNGNYRVFVDSLEDHPREKERVKIGDSEIEIEGVVQKIYILVVVEPKGEFKDL